MGLNRPRPWLRRLSGVLAVLVLLVIVLPWTLGALMSRDHTGRGERTLRAPIDQVWASIAGFDDMGEWVPDVANMTRVADVNGLPSYEMRGEHSTVTFTFTEVSAPTRLVVQLQDAAETTGGVWTYQLSSVPDGTRVTITEEGWTAPPYFRFMLWVFGHDRTIQSYLDALDRKLQR